MDKTYILGLDIGYSNLKIAMGYNDLKNGEAVSLPIGAAPVRYMPRQIAGGGGDFMQVIVDGEPWAVGVEPDRLQDWERELHKDYPFTSSYMALYYGALLRTGQTEIDAVVTGLPVDQSGDAAYCEKLRERLIGEHKITPKRTVTVKDVVILPQPAGAYLDAVNNLSDSDELLDVIHGGRTVIIDPGYYSVDWVALDGGEIRFQSSGTSLKAMSVLLGEVNDMIREEYGSSCGVEKIEKAIRSGKSEVLVFGQRVDLTGYIDRASKEVASNALISMKKTMRTESGNVDFVLLTGGGAKNYQEAAQELFPNCKIYVSDDPVLANARGFWYFAK